MNNLFMELKDTLSLHENLLVNGSLNKALIEDLALKLDENLLKLLISNELLKKHFFTQINDIFVFDKLKFQSFINNKSFLPDSFTSYKNKIGLVSDSGFLTYSKDIVLAWPYKDCLLEGGQKKEEEERDEIFWNEVLAPDEIDRLLEPKVFTNFKKLDQQGEKKVEIIEDFDNLLIRGNNLLALASLKKIITGRVKLIYIDPPFHTPKPDDSFQYNDKFKHSTWLTFMKNRLELAYDLLSSDGFIFVHLDDNEVFYCKVLIDEIFGRENYLNTVTLTTNDPSGFKATGDKLFSTANYLLIYSRGGNKSPLKKVYIETEYDTMYSMVLMNKEAPYTKWKWKDIKEQVANEKGFESAREARGKLKEKFELMVADYAMENADRVFRTAAITGGARKKRLHTINNSKANRNRVFVHPGEDISDFFILNGEQILFYDKRIQLIDGELLPGRLLTDVWTDISWTGIANEGGVKLKNGKKPEKLIARILELTTNKGDLVLDFFAGSGTTAAVAHKMGRHFISVEQLDYGESDSVVRLKNVINGDQTGISKTVSWNGGGSVIYLELKQINEYFILDIINAKDNQTLEEIWGEMADKGFLSYKVNPKTINPQANDFQALSFEDRKKFLIEVLDKNMLYVNYSEINDQDFKVTEEDKLLNAQFYSLHK